MHPLLQRQLVCERQHELRCPPSLVTLVVVVAALGLAAGLLPGAGGSAARPASVAAHAPARVPVAARGPVSARVGRDDPRYRVAGGRVTNPAQRLSARFSRAGVTVTSAGGRVRLRLASVGRAGAERRVARVAPHAHANRVDYARGGIDEWYANGPLGLEQGFDVRARPAGGGALTLSLARSSGVASGSAVAFGHLRYGGLTASDSRGHALPSRLVVHSGRVQIRVDDRRAAYPVHIDPLVQQARLSPSDGERGDQFGLSLAMSGDTLAVASPRRAGGGAIYVFVKPTGGGWADATETAKLTPSAGNASKFLGPVAIDGDTIVAADPFLTEGANGFQGAVLVFVKPVGGWADAHETAALTASDGGAFDEIGAGGVGVSGDTVIAGASSHKVGTTPNQGAVYVFTKPAAGWADEHEAAQLTASDGREDDHLGIASVDGDVVVAGAPDHAVGGNLAQGAAYVFVKPAAGWKSATQNAELTASNGGSGDNLGETTDVSGDVVAVGAPERTVGGRFEQGSAYVFEKPSAGWSDEHQQATLTASDGQAGDKLGVAVATSGDTVLAGADHFGNTNSPIGSSAYAFRRPGERWRDESETQKLTAPDDPRDAIFGDALATSGDLAVIGAPSRFMIEAVSSGGAGAPARVPAGAAYVFGLKRAVTPLAITHVKQSARAWRRRTTFSFTLSKQARVALRFTHRVQGRTRGAGTLRRNGHAGLNRVRFSGRIPGRKRLRPGRYAVRIVATAGGQRAASRRLSFRVLRRR
jgi:hypothetical protein